MNIRYPIYEGVYRILTTVLTVAISFLLVRHLTLPCFLERKHKLICIKSEKDQKSSVTKRENCTKDGKSVPDPSVRERYILYV